MATEAPLYDLVLMLSPEAEDSTRSKILNDVETRITQAGGSVERNDDWGRRPMAYEIRHQPEAEYHLLQFHAPGSLIEDLSHTLRITDGVVRHRVIKVRPGTPEAPSSIPVVAAVSSSGSGSSGSSGAGAGPGTGPGPGAGAAASASSAAPPSGGSTETAEAETDDSEASAEGATAES
jgi:small subunit ribosomal protein S6